MLSPLTIVSLDQGKLYGARPTIGEVQAGMAADLGLQPSSSAEPAIATRREPWLSRLGKWMTERAGQLQPNC